MIMLLTAVGASFVAVIGWTFLNPWPSPVIQTGEDLDDEERAQIMESIARSFF
jgi:hypothetical protein